MELCVVAAHGYPPGLIFHPLEHGAGRLFKEHQLGWNQDPSRLWSSNPRKDQAEEILKPLIGKLEGNKLLRSHFEIGRPGLVDLQDFPSHSILFGFGIAERCSKHDRSARFIFSGSSEEESHGVILSELVKLEGSQAWSITMPHQSLVPYCEECFHDAESQSFFLPPSSEFCYMEPLVGDLNHRHHNHLPDDQRLFVNNRMEMKDALFSLSEVYSSKKSIKLTKQALLVPYFERRIRKGGKTNSAELSSKHEPTRSVEKVKYGTSKKKSNMKVGKQRDFYRDNCLHACESLLSLIFDKRRQDGTAMLSLKRSGAEIPNLLTQFSASIAGTGLAVLLSVICKVAGGRVPFCRSKLLNTGLGVGLIWLSWAVNKLRDMVVTINKNPGKFGTGKEEEMMSSLDRSVRDIYFRVATLMAVAILRFV